MKLNVQQSTFNKIYSDAIVFFIFEDKDIFNQQIRALAKYLKTQIERIIKLEKFKGKQGTSAYTYTDGNINSDRIILIGLGKKDSLSLESYRKASANAIKIANQLEVKSIAINHPGKTNFSIEDLTQSLIEGAKLSQYKFDKYITEKDKSERRVKELIIFHENKKITKIISKSAKMAQIICDGVIFARDLVNAPASDIYPETLANIAKKSTRKYGYRCIVWNEKKIEKMKFGGLLAVSRGSFKPPRFIILQYNGNKKIKRPIVLIGKGVTFDSGGISLKPSAGMSEMKMDMSGAATVIATIQTAARLNLKVNLVGLIPATENMPSGSALKPGDIIRHFGGKTSEVDNTDAEGRLILADALVYAHRYNPEAVIELSTLTGSVIITLGHHASAILGNDNELVAKLISAGEKTYERLWQLPLFSEYEKQIKSDVADVKNIGSRGAGTITAALFLKKFIQNKNKKEYKWAHIDIAGTAIMDEPSEYIPRGGTGIGVRLLIEYLKNLNQ